MSWTEIKSAIDQQGTAFEEFKKVNDQRIEEIRKGNESKATELAAKLDKIEKEITSVSKLKKDLETELEYQKDRIEELETRSKTPGKTAAEKQKDEYKDLFGKWVRSRGQDAAVEVKLQDIAKKDVTIGSAAGGGYAVPEDIARQIELLELKYSPVRRLVKVVQTGTSDYKELVTIHGGTSGWVGETGSRTATGTPNLRERAPTHGELYAYPQVSEWSLDDIFFNVEQWLTEDVARDFAKAEGAAVISGNGSNKPTGMTNTAPVSTADNASPMRAAAAYQFVAPTAASPNASVTGPNFADGLITLVYTLNAAYRSNATFVMNSTTAGFLRKVKDSNTGQYLWQPGLQAGEPDRILGYRHETWEDMPDIDVDSLPIAFGDFKRGYLLTDRTGLRITRDNVSNVGYVRFYVRKRVGGCPLNNDAIKFLKISD